MHARGGIALVVAMGLSGAASPARALVEINLGDTTKIEIGLLVQGWYQFTEKGAANGTGLHDLTARRAGVALKANITPHVDVVAVLASDRLGQEGVSSPSLGLGRGFAIRDLWLTLKLSEALKVQAGRMYVPLTRALGTTNVQTLLTTDLPFLQGGIRGSAFYTGKVGRDDGIALWGNPWHGRIQYRLMIAQGVEGAADPKGNPRVAGRVALNLLEPEKGWLNHGAYLGEKKVLSVGLGFDMERALTLGGMPGLTSRSLTADFFFDHPVGEGAVTVETAFVEIKNSARAHAASDLRPGDEARTWYLQGGYLLPGTIGPGRLQPYVRVERIEVKGRGATTFPAFGLNYLLKGHALKLSADYTRADPSGGRVQSIVTMQIAAAF